MTYEPACSAVDIDRDEARSAARDAADPWPEMTRREIEAEDFGDWFTEVVYDVGNRETAHLGRRVA